MLKKAVRSMLSPVSTFLKEAFMVLKNLFRKKDRTFSQNNEEQNVSSSSKVNSQQEDLAPVEPPVAMHLEQAMIENIRNDTVETRAKVYQELLFSDLFLALSDPVSSSSEPAAGEQNQDFNVQAPVKSDAASNVHVAILSNSQGVSFAAVFTSAAAARRWRAEGGQYVSIRGQDIFKLLEPSPAEVIVINPGSAPLVVLNKLDYRQLALGIVPQTQSSPVQVQSFAQKPDERGSAHAMQIAFPPDAFTEFQKKHVLEVLSELANIEAVALGAVLPPAAQAPAADWLRTIFLRICGVEANQKAVEDFCIEVRSSLKKNNTFFEGISFEVGVMSDPQFWLAMHENNCILLDKNPPQKSVSE